MLILCYGITKSGSTLAFELVKGMLKSAGHPQVRLADGVVEAKHPINFIAGVLDRKRVRKVLSAVGPDRIIAVKTHADFDERQFAWLEKKLASGDLLVVASYRDPRDICLSLIDAGARARAKGVKPFSRIDDFPAAISGLQKQILKFRKWGSLRGALRLEYELVAFSPDKALDLIEGRLKLNYDRAAAKKHAFETAFTQKNKAQPNRHKHELDDDQARIVTEAFRSFISGVYENTDGRWFSDYRDQVLSGVAPDRP